MLACDVEHRWSNEKRGWVQQLAVTNRGPSVAHDASVTARPAQGGPGLSYGPTQLGDLEAGQTVHSDLALRPADDTSPLTVVLNWRDQGGAQTHETKVQAPPPPPLVREQVRRTGPYRPAR